MKFRICVIFLVVISLFLSCYNTYQLKYNRIAPKMYAESKINTQTDKFTQEIKTDLNGILGRIKGIEKKQKDQQEYYKQWKIYWGLIQDDKNKGYFRRR